MGRRSQHSNNSHIIFRLPNDIHYAISRYLSSVDIQCLSQSCLLLRSLYHPILYSNCKVSNTTGYEIAPIQYWIIPPWVLFCPSEYSWFPNKSVLKIVVKDSFDTRLLKDYFDISCYPNLISFKVFPRTYLSKLVITSNPSIFKEKHLKFPHLSLNSLLPFAKSREFIEFSSISRHCILNCSNQNTKEMITSLNLNVDRTVSNDLLKTLSDSFSKDLKSFTNLKDLKIWSCDKFDYDTLKILITLIVSLESLDSLMINHKNNSNNDLYLRLFDNLQGSWNVFNLYISSSHFPENSTIIRLPTVTNLQIKNDYNLFHQFNGKFEFGNRLEQLTIPFHSNDSFLSEYHSRQNVLDALITLKVELPKDLDLSSKPHQWKTIFTKELPNLKVFELKMTDFPTMPLEYRDLYSECFEVFSASIPFGEFDILNYKLIMRYIKILRYSAHLTRVNGGIRDNALDIHEHADALKDATADSEIFDLFVNFFWLRFESIIFLKDYSSIENFIIKKAVISVLFLQLLKYTPNLEKLILLGVSLAEEFPTFHRLVKYHKNLKTVSTRMIDNFFFEEELYKINKMYHKYYLSLEREEIIIRDNQVFVKPGFDEYMFSDPKRYEFCHWRVAKYNVEDFRNDALHYRHLEDDMRSDEYIFENQAYCAFAEPLPMNINEFEKYAGGEKDLDNEEFGVASNLDLDFDSLGGGGGKAWDWAW